MFGLVDQNSYLIDPKTGKPVIVSPETGRLKGKNMQFEGHIQRAIKDLANLLFPGDKGSNIIVTAEDLKRIDINKYLTPVEKVILEQLNLYAGPTSYTPILTSDKPAIVQQLKRQIPGLNQNVAKVFMKNAPSFDFKVGDQTTSARQMINKALQGQSLPPISMDETLGQILNRYGVAVNE